MYSHISIIVYYMQIQIQQQKNTTFKIKNLLYKKKQMIIK